MGICDSETITPNLIRIDEQIKNLEKDYLIENSIREKIKNKYKLNNIIGQGSFGKVFIATDKSGKKYAIKCLKKKKSLKFQHPLNEIKMGRNLKHHNILGIKEIYEDLNKIFIVMDYCDGGDLFDYIIKNPEGKLNDTNTIDILIQILDAVNYLHNEIKICHRDLKPENCLIIINGNNKPLIKLIDFGTAQHINKMKKITGKIGTIKYMAPEIFLSPFYDEKVDLWSVGIILYNMTTGREAFVLEEKQDFNKIQIYNKEINFDLIRNDDIKQLCKELLEKNPNKRIDAKKALEKAKIIKKKFATKIN